MDALDHQAIELIQQIQQIRVKLVRLLGARYGQLVLDHYQLYLPEREAQKIAQQTIKEVVLAWDFDKNSSENFKGNFLSVKLFTIATRLCRVRAREIQMEQFVDSNGQNPQASLSPKEKEDLMLLKLRRHLQLPWAEIAKIMGIRSAVAAKQRGHRLLNKLRESKNVR